MSKFLAFSKRKSNEVVNHFSLLNNSFNLKNEHSNSLGKNKNKNRDIFLQYIIAQEFRELIFFSHVVLILQ